MADETKYYAWSRIQYDVVLDEPDPGNGNRRQILGHKFIQVGEEVSAESLGVSKPDFQDMVNAGSVRAYPYPNVPEGWADSPINWLKEQTRRIEQQARDLQSSVNPSLLQSSMTGNVKLPDSTEPDESKIDGPASAAPQNKTVNV